MTPKQERIYKYVEKNPGCTRRELVVFLGSASWRNTYEFVRAMIDAGLLVLRETHKLYAVKQDL